MTPTGQRFYICLLKNLSLRGASQGLRVGSDVAIARYAFEPVSCPSFKSQNRVLNRVFGGCHPELVEGRRVGGGLSINYQHQRYLTNK